MALVMRLAAIAAALVGYWLLVRSPQLGMAAANDWLRSMGGSLGGDGFQVVRENAITAYRVIGAVLLGVGLFRALQYPEARRE